MRPVNSRGTERVLQNAQAASVRFRHRNISTEHLLLGLLQERNSATAILKHLGLDRETLRDTCKSRCELGDSTTEETGGFSPIAQRVLCQAEVEASELGHTEVDTRHLLVGLILEGEGIAGDVLRQSGVTVKAVREAILTGVSARRSSHTSAKSTPAPVRAMPEEKRSFWPFKRIWSRA